MSKQVAEIESHIFDISTQEEFNALALEIFYCQAARNGVYEEWLSYLSVTAKNVTALQDIPFLPIGFFKTHSVTCNTNTPELIFQSSGTTDAIRSQHLVAHAGLYHRSCISCFERFYGPLEDYCIMAVLPSYTKRKSSSLACMAETFIEKSGHPQSGFYMNKVEKLAARLEQLDARGQKVLLLGLSYALLGLLEARQFKLNNTTVMETGGMKGNRPEMVREELHGILKAGFGVNSIHSEYGMTELLSQSYSTGNGIFHPPPWKQIFIREVNDPLSYTANGTAGGINIIDLANLHSCSFIATEDQGCKLPGGAFGVLGRLDHSDLRGCNLMTM